MKSINRREIERTKNMMEFEIHTEENGKAVDLGIYGMDEEHDGCTDECEAANKAAEELESDFQSEGYFTGIQRVFEFNDLHVWNADEKRVITIWASRIE